jgi:hypothetical protein
VTWQAQLEPELIDRLPQAARHRIAGSAQNPTELDGWSDLDLHIYLSRVDEPIDLFAGVRIFVVERTVELYGRWRRELEPGYSPDWSGLDALLNRGLAE